MSEKKIKIIKDGPYIVYGAIPLKEMIITKVEGHYELVEGDKLPQNKTYTLCRCGKSKNHPFCDFSHKEENFDGKETADRRPYRDRIQEKIEGEKVTLLDDGRCAFARFCHRETGDAWSLAQNCSDDEQVSEAIKAACECPSGRLVILDKELNEIEYEYEQRVEIFQDPEKNVSGPIVVKGFIPIESSDNFQYEKRNRVALCRCGHSQNKPFCDAMHVPKKFKDK
ncbi:MAG: CDGSH iron-sulfur domain-containing protein [Bacillota bacterium]